MSEISKKILNLMKDKNITYGELSNKTGIYKSALQRYATGSTTKIPSNRIKKIANALDVTPQYLVGWAEQKAMNENKSKENFQYNQELMDYAIHIRGNDYLSNLINEAKDLTPEDLKPVLILINGIRKEKGLD